MNTPTMNAKERLADNGWSRRHNQALALPNKVERPIVNMLQAWSLYAVEYSNRYESEIGTDAVLGEAWLDIAQAMLALLNGELGRLDGGTLDAFIRDTVTHHKAELPA